VKRFDLDAAVLSLLEASINDIKATFNFKSVPALELDVPKERSFGDLTTNAAMKIGRETRHPAKEVAAFLVERMNTRLKKTPLSEYIDKIEIKGPGFINFHFRNTSLYYVLDEIEELKSSYGRNDLGKKSKLQLEFASANPTGPLTIAHGRQAAFGDSLANILEFSGYKVTREYYLNDEGRQINLLGESIKASYLELIGAPGAYPPDGYKGAYIKDIAIEIKKRYGTRKKNAKGAFFSEYGYRILLAGIKSDLTDFGVKFDVWYSQRSLTRKGLIRKALSILRKKGFLYEADGAVWFKSSELGDEKDRVIIKKDGSYTYIGPDIAYHMDKFRRGFKKIVNTWGPDHHGYIPRLKAAVQALGYDPKLLHCLIIQLVTLYQGRKPMKMSTRAGQFLTLKDLAAEVGRDVARFFFLMRRRDSHLNFDLELAKKESMDNPVYYIQYAHARISSMLSVYQSEKRGSVKLNKTLLEKKEEFEIIRLLREFPLVVESCAAKLEVYPLLSYLQGLAASFHGFYNKHRVVTDNLELTRARINLVDSARGVLASGLKLLGVAAPSKM